MYKKKYKTTTVDRKEFREKRWIENSTKRKKYKKVLKERGRENAVIFS